MRLLLFALFPEYRGGPDFIMPGDRNFPTKGYPDPSEAEQITSRNFRTPSTIRGPGLPK